MTVFRHRLIRVRTIRRFVGVLAFSALVSCDALVGGEPYQANGMDISIAAEVITIGGITDIAATPTFNGTGAMLASDVYWSSSDTTVATVKRRDASGVTASGFSGSAIVTGKGVGKATIRALYSSFTDSAVVNVVQPPPL